jgi:F-type H+-transporting ATPase subunit epsilon
MNLKKLPHSMNIEIVSIEKKIFSTESGAFITLPTLEGNITILPHHEPMIIALGNGKITLAYGEEKQISFASLGGVAETNGTLVRVLVDYASDGDGLSSDELRAKEQAAREALEQYKKQSQVVDPSKLLELEESYLREQVRARFVQ